MSTRELLVVCAAMLVVFVVGVALKASGSRWAGSDAWSTGGDFVAFYVSGRILDDHGGASLYDIDLQERVHREVVPGSATLNRTFAYPPYIAALFVPLTKLPLAAALALFMIATPLIFLGGLALLNARFGPTDIAERALLFLGALSFFPFMGYTWLGAQISTIGFAAIALALFTEDRGRLVASGLALSVCLYKPTLLILLLPMLLVTGSGRQLAGFAAGTGLQILLWLAIGGTASMAAFVDEIKWTMSRTTSSGQLFNPYRYVDLNAFFRLLPFGRSVGASVALGAVVLLLGAALVSMWHRSRSQDRSTRLLVWGATLTFTLVLNLYVPFYDTLFVVAAAVVAVDALRDRGWIGWNRLKTALLCVYLTPWIAEVGARTFRVQIYTLVLAGFGTLLLVEANRKAPSPG